MAPRLLENQSAESPAVLCLLFGSVSDVATISGGDRYCGEVWSHWSRAGRDVRLITTTFTEKAFRRFGYDVPTRIISRNEDTIGRTRTEYAVRFLRALLKTLPETSDITFAASSYFFDFIPALLLKILKRTRRIVVPIFHLIPSPWARSGSMLVNVAAWLENRVMVVLVRRFADLVIVDNPELQEQLRCFGVPSTRLYLTTMGVRQRSRPTRTRSQRRYDAIYVGRLMKQKGVDELIRIWKVVVTRFPEARIALVGATDPELPLFNLIESSGLGENVDVHSGLSDETVWDYLCDSRIFVTASREEGYGLSVLEALAAGLPCVTYDLPAFKFAFPAGRISPKSFSHLEFAECVCNLLGQPEDLTRLAEQASSYYGFKSWESVADELWARIGEQFLT